MWMGEVDLGCPVRLADHRGSNDDGLQPMQESKQTSHQAICDPWSILANKGHLANPSHRYFRRNISNFLTCWPIELKPADIWLRQTKLMSKLRNDDSMQLVAVAGMALSLALVCDWTKILPRQLRYQCIAPPRWPVLIFTLCNVVVAVLLHCDLWRRNRLVCLRLGEPALCHDWTLRAGGVHGNAS